MRAAKGVFFEHLSVMEEASLSNTVSGTDIVVPVDISGDRKPVHFGDDGAATVRFEKRSGCGMRSAAYILAVFGMNLPGPGAIPMYPTPRFKTTVKIGEAVVIAVEVTELVSEKWCARFECVCAVNDKPVVEGETMLILLGRLASAHSQRRSVCRDAGGARLS